VSVAVEPPAQVGATDSPIPLAEFRSKTDNFPRKLALTWQQWVERLTRYDTRHEKNGPGWSPTLYREKARRGKKGVELVTALALDFDHCAPPRDRLEGLAWIGHTTFSHTDDDPRWRVVIRLSRWVEAKDWPTVWARAQHYFGATADEQCKDCSRFFYLPSCRPDSPHQVEHHDGKPLNIDDLPALPELPRHRQARQVERRTSSAYAARAFDDEVAAVASAAPGQRNAQLNRSAFSLGQLVGAGELIQSQVEAALEDAAEHCGLAREDGIDQVRRTIASGLEAGIADPRVIPAVSRRLLSPVPATNGLALKSDDVAEPPPPSILPTDDGHEPPSRRWNDMWNAEQYAARFGDHMRYCGESGWFFYKDGAWHEDRTGHAMRLAKRMVRQMLREAASADDDDEAKGLATWAIKCHAAAKLDSTLRLAQTEARLAITITDFDQHPLLFNTLNGTVDLRTGALAPHAATDLLTRQSPTEFNATARCPRWEQFLDEVFDGDRTLIAYLQRLLGYSLTGLQIYHLLAFLWGAGRNGKTTLLEVISKILGDYARSVSSELLLLSRENGDYNVAQLRGARLVITSETGQHRRFDEARVKLLTGGDTLPARHPYGRPFTFVPTHHVWLMSNHKSPIEGMDRGIWSRIKLIEFPNRFELPPEGVDPKEWQPGPHIRRADPNLAAKLEAERSGILNWLVHGAATALRHGLQEPASVTAATEHYREQMDVLGGFLDECCDIGAWLSDSSKHLYGTYRSWCQRNGVEAVAINKFGMLLSERGEFFAVKPSTGQDRNHRRWSGLQVKPSVSDDDA
jgi:putative DNA primase/helicase